MLGQIDGEAVRISILKKSQWTRELVDFISAMPVTKLWDNRFATLIADDDYKELAYPGYKAFNLAEVSQDRSEERYGLRPTLQFLVGGETIEKENPNGSISMGGTLYINGEPYGMKDLPYYYTDGSCTFEIGDTVPDKELFWLWWDGQCICLTTILRNLSLETIKKNGYI